jgi:hypothetical protein
VSRRSTHRTCGGLDDAHCYSSRLRRSKPQWRTLARSEPALRDRVSGRFLGYALGSALENHDEEGVGSDPRFGENNTFYLQAIATLPTVQNDVELGNYLLESLRERAIAAGFESLSTLIEDRLRHTGPA